MIPLTLKLKNFLSYGSELQTIDFTPYPLICLSGKNGHGKSALLDAITWAIWGTARKESGATRADQGLMRLGQTNMLVILDFSCNGNHYRVRREYTKSFGKQYVTLDFGMIDQETEKHIPLTEKTVRATQDKIETTLNLTFESFINSAFLRQGNANEFSKKTPRDRKHILAAILGINRYDSIKTLAMEKIKQAAIEQTTIAALQTTAKQELDTTAHLPEQLCELEKTLAQILHKEQELNAQLQTLAQDYATHRKRHQEYEILKAHLEHCTTEEQQLLAKIRTLYHAWKELHRTFLHLPDTTNLEEKKHTLMNSLTEQQQLFAQQLALKEELLQKKSALQQKEKELNDISRKQLYEKQAHLENLRMQEQSLKQTMVQTQATAAATACEHTIMHKEYTAMQERSTLLAHELEKAQPLEKQFEKRKEFYQQCMEQGKVCQHELAILQQKKLLVHNEDNPSCPLCEQNLSASRKRFIKKTFEEQESALTRRIKRLTNVVKTLKQLLTLQHTDLEHYKVIRQEQAHLQATCQERLSQLTKQENLQAAHTQLMLDHEKKQTALHNDLQNAEKELAFLTEQGQQNNDRDTHYQTIKAAYTVLEQRLANLTYDQKIHDNISKELQDLNIQLATLKNTADQKPLQEQRKHEINTLIITIKKLRERSRDLEQRGMAYTALPAKIQELALQQTALEVEQKNNNALKETVLREKGKLENAQEKRLQFEKAYNDYTVQQATITQTIDDYSIIASATGKDGIQALLIDEALPEIEHETNVLLSKLTNNQTHLCIESLRDLKKGGTRETLDINISDPTGIRSYELFSGGEAFRIDFALRIAIAKLLARRAGTALQTLIIDEGFGSQDEEGLAHIMDAVYKIQDDFAKIIIVSHLSSMKEQFPVHFFIEKTPSGSQVTVVDQG